jgi:single-stranded-DNA-specific exonuclease
VLRGERIHVHGDYDVDGISATSVLVLGLRTLGADVHYHIVQRGDGAVGLGLTSLMRDHVPHSPNLLITADCGTSNLEAIDEAGRRDIDVIVVDHHVPGANLPKCVAILNPQMPRSGFPFSQLAAVGVAFNLMAALDHFLDREDTGRWPRLPLALMADIVALGTVADLVPLVDENRVFVSAGLKLIRGARRPGICALMNCANLLHDDSGRSDSVDAINARTIGYRIAPLLNAAGRMDDARKCVELLVADSFRSADIIARELVQWNQKRQQAEREVLEQAIAEAETRVAAQDRALILFSPTWHPGVLGIVASRLVERFSRPVAVLSIDPNGLAKGSIRSPEGVDMLRALAKCRDLLETHGGHKLAAGVALKAHRLPEFRERVQVALADQLVNGALPSRCLEVDALVDLATIDRDWVTELDALAPFGAGNAEPVFEARNVVAQHPRVVGNGVRFRLRAAQRVCDAVAVGAAHRIDDFKRPVSIAFTPRVARRGDESAIELVIRDFVVEP